MSTPAAPVPPKSRRHANVVNVNELEWSPTAHGERFAQERKGLGAAAAGRLLGCSLYRVPAGKAAFPAHLHHANEEAIYVLAGRGTLRLGKDEIAIGPGDYIALPPAGDGVAHYLTGAGLEPIEYLCLSTMLSPEIVEYPDSGKVGLRNSRTVSTGVGTGASQVLIRHLFRTKDETSYYDGE
ncbi:MAG: cupin domain-containing protein [Candidatus Lambdaproteobacteria bacterium]|nr:cupin domain-containing protein [Candidatus Lambdaproteobacteria bacterium]